MSAHDRQVAEDRVREAIHAALTGTEYLPREIVLLTDVVITFGCIDTDGDQGLGMFTAGSLAATRGLADFAYTKISSAMDDD